MPKQARPQAKSSYIWRDDEQGNEGFPKEITLIKAAESSDFATQRGHAQATAFSN
jgi:hypothetical protein